MLWWLQSHIASPPTSGARASPEEKGAMGALSREQRAKLKQAVHMSFYEGASGWLDRELARERVALTDDQPVCGTPAGLEGNPAVCAAGFRRGDQGTAGEPPVEARAIELAR